MTENDFRMQAVRLSNTYGKATYSTERLSILWREVSRFEAKWFERVVDNFIGSMRQAPLMPEFREEIAKQREKEWEREKQESAQDAKDFWAGTYQPEDVKTICQYIKRRLMGGVSDEDYASFIKHLEHTASGR